MSEPRIAALIPCLNVAPTIAEVVAGAYRHVPHVLVVDDGSNDATATLAAEAGASVVRHEQNRGKGSALRTGMERLRADGYTHAFCLDGDGQHLTDEMPDMIREAVQHPSAIILGERIRDGHVVAPIRRFGNDFADWWVSLAAGREFADSQCGFRIYPIETTLALGVRGDHYDFESEVLILAGRRGVEMRTCDVRVYYPPPDEHVSHFDAWLDTVRIIGTVVPFLVRAR